MIGLVPVFDVGGMGFFPERLDDDDDDDDAELLIGYMMAVAWGNSHWGAGQRPGSGVAP